MKCDELMKYGMNDPTIGDDYEMYRVADVDAAIAELKAKLESVQATAYAESVDAGMENRKLKLMLASECRALREMNVKAQEEITALKDAQRWRNVDDMFPTADQGYILVLWEDGLPDICYIGAEDDVIETVRDRGEGHSVKWWMPMPSDPKEIK